MDKERTMTTNEKYPEYQAQALADFDKFDDIRGFL